MKKTLLATAIAGALGVSAAAQAATVYDQDGTRLDLYGRIAMGIQGGGSDTKVVNEGETDERIEKAGGSEFVNIGSRFGLRGSQQITSDLSAYGRAEFRFNGDEVNRDAMQVRNSYLGLKSNQMGSLQAGNFDNFYLNTVGAPFDVYVVNGYEFAGGGTGAKGQGDSIGYISPNLEGFQVYLMGKHYTGNEQIAGSDGSNSSTIETAGGAVYEVDALRLALGYAEDKDSPNVADGSGEVIYGGSAQFAFTPEFSARLGYETQSDNEDKLGLGFTYGIDAWKVYADYYHVSANGDNKEALQAQDASTSRNSWSIGTQYNVSSNFQVFAEVNEEDQPSITIGGGETADELRSIRDSVYWVTGARYFF
ncbi:porin [Halomonas alkalisoli]|uniref:porin n=1 Tax=Halomonas alkalisoli TaxID=2907158 RepID=UPI001F2B717A|nr:porin [Halomonas alkalisoli]MCE9680881.1 porin [Halomonas alkalisoli]